MIIVGYRLNAKEPAPKALERILGLAPDAARKLARGFPAVVRQNLGAGEAELVAARLRDAGALVELREPAGASARKRISTPLPPPASAATAAARQRAIPTPRPPPGSVPVAELNVDTAAYRLGDFGLGPAPAARAPAAAAAAVARPATAIAAAAVRAPTEDLSFDLELSSGPLLELEQAPANTNARQAGGPESEPPGFDARFETSAEAAPPPQVEERAFRAIQRTPRGAESRRSLTPRQRGLGARIGAAAQGWLPSLLLLALLGFGTLCAVGYALDPDHVFALLQPAEQTSDAPPEAEHASDRHPLLRAAPAVARGPLAAILRARIAGVHPLPSTFRSPAGKTVDCALVEQREDDDTQQRLAALRRTGGEVAVPGEAQPMLSEHARALRAALGATLRLTPLCLTL